jgi:uncharacterized protein YqeY
MPIKSQLQADLRDALRARDEARKSVIRLTLAEIVNAEVKHGGELDEVSIAAVLQREARKRRETITELRGANRPELLRQEEGELAILEEYVPRQLSREEIAEEARHAIEAAGATGIAQLGSVMKVLMPTLRGRADGRLANEVVRELLAGQ